MEQLKGKSKVFKSGNSYGIRLTASDKRTLNINAGDPDILKTIDSLYDENKDLMEFLKDKWII